MAARPSLKVDLTAVLIVKLCLLAALWLVFVRGAGVTLDPGAVARHALLIEFDRLADWSPA